MKSKFVERYILLIPGIVAYIVVPAVLIASSLAMSQACSGGASNPDPELISVGGTYSTVVSLTENSCGSGVTVQAMPTVVTHSKGATVLSLQHGPLTYNGALSSSGAFTTQPTLFQDSQSGATSTLSVAGQFATTGFTADVTVGVVQSTAPTTCGYKVHWVGTKQGSANTIP